MRLILKQIPNLVFNIPKVIAENVVEFSLETVQDVHQAGKLCHCIGQQWSVVSFSVGQCGNGGGKDPPGSLHSKGRQFVSHFGNDSC